MVSFNQVKFQPIPAETALMAISTVEKANKYIQIGDQIDPLFADIIPLERMQLGTRVGETYCLYALICAFQFFEKAPDVRMVEEIDIRVDLKYGLHLPLEYPKFEPRVLCEFRQQLLSEPVDFHFFDQLLQRLRERGFFSSTSANRLSARNVLIPACYAGQLEWFLTDAAKLYERAEWEILNTRVRDSNKKFLKSFVDSDLFTNWPETGEGWQELIQKIGSEIHQSFVKIERLHQGTAPFSLEYINHKQQWLSRFEAFYYQVSPTPEHIWGQQVCASCNL